MKKFFNIIMLIFCFLLFAGNQGCDQRMFGSPEINIKKELESGFFHQHMDEFD